MVPLLHVLALDPLFTYSSYYIHPNIIFNRTANVSIDFDVADLSQMRAWCFHTRWAHDFGLNTAHPVAKLHHSSLEGGGC